MLRKEEENYRLVFSVAASPDVTMKAITTRIKDWWTENFDGSADEPGKKFTVCFDHSFYTFIIGELVPDQRIVWVLSEVFMQPSSLSKQSEGANTKIIWEISTEAGRTRVTFIHLELKRSLDCYDICVDEWLHYAGQWLKTLLSEGVENQIAISGETDDKKIIL